MSALFTRIIDGRTDLVGEFLDAGNAATAQDTRGTPLIKWCAYHGDTGAVRMLLDRGESLRTLGHDLGLNAAAFHGHWQLCQFLLQQGADANSTLTVTGETPLHSANCRANRPVYDHVIEILLAHGADPNATTRPGVETGAFMRDCRTRAETPLHRAAAFGTAYAVAMLLEAGGDREARDANGDTPLSWASWHLRPPTILRQLCYGDFSIHPENHSDYDHGAGWGQNDPHNRGKPDS